MALGPPHRWGGGWEGGRPEPAIQALPGGGAVPELVARLVQSEGGLGVLRILLQGLEWGGARPTQRPCIDVGDLQSGSESVPGSRVTRTVPCLGVVYFSRLMGSHHPDHTSAL